MNNVEFHGFRIKLRRGRGYKNFRLSYRGLDDILLSAPKSSSIKECMKFLEDSKQWFVAHKSTQYTIHKDKIFLFGEWIKSELQVLDEWNRLWLYNDKKIVEFYRLKLQEYISISLPKFSKLLGLYPSDVVYGKSLNTLGSCYTVSKKIRFSLRLSLMPYYVIDSIIIHELTHLEFRGHDCNFWNFVAQHDINLVATKTYLKTNSGLNRYIAKKLFKN